MTDSPAGPYRIDVHAHYLAPPYTEALAETETWLIGGIPEGDPQPALGEVFGAEDLRTIERAGSLAQLEHLASRLGLPQR